MNAALLLVDMQNDFLDGPGMRPSKRVIVRGAARLLSAWRRAGRPVGHVVLTVDAAGERRMPHWKRDGVVKCVEGTPGHAEPEAVRAREGEPVFHKTFYSGFQDPGLEKWLRSKGVKGVVLAGVQMHACVRATARAAYALGFEVTIADDACGSDEPIHAAATRRHMKPKGIDFRPVGWLERTVRGETPGAVRHFSPRDLGKALWEVKSSSMREIAGATGRAREAQPGWAARGAAERAGVLVKLAGLLRREREGLARRLAEEIGKPVLLGRAEVDRAAELAEMAAQAAQESMERTTASGVKVRRRPVGVIAAVTPFNNPVGIALGKVAPALAFGNAAVLKGAPEAQGVTGVLMGLLLEAGVPQELVGVVHGGRDEAIALAEACEVDAVTMAGSEAAGAALAEVCGHRSIPFQGEMGGNNAAIVLSDADLEDAATKIVSSAFGYAGQRCTATRRVIVEGACRERFVGLLERAAAALPMGDPLEEPTRVGPLIGAGKREDVEDLLASVEKDGHSVTRPHGAAPKGGAYCAPAIVGCDDRAHEVVQEETFGPVVVVQRAAGMEEALALCNGVRQGLAAGIFTRSRPAQERFLSGARCGVLKVNRATADVGVDAPFGGWKASGLGPPKHGSGNVEFYTRAQAVYA